MVRLGIPSDTSKYIALDGMTGFAVHQAGAIPEWRDGDVLYFKKSKKLTKVLDRLGIVHD